MVPIYQDCEIMSQRELLNLTRSPAKQDSEYLKWLSDIVQLNDKNALIAGVMLAAISQRLGRYEFVRDTKLYRKTRCDRSAFYRGMKKLAENGYVQLTKHKEQQPRVHLLIDSI